MEYLRFLTPKRLAKAVYGVVVALLAAEIVIAVFLPQEEVIQRELIERDHDLGFRLSANYRGTQINTDIPIRTNAWGLRDRDYEPRTADSVRIYAIGDSLVFGHGVRVEETFPRFLESELGKRLCIPVEVVNGGVPGYGTVHAARLFAKTVDTVAPDVVIIAITVFNDIEDNTKFHHHLHRWQREPGQLQQIRAWFRHKSQVYRLFRRYRAGVSSGEMMAIHREELEPKVRAGIEAGNDALLAIKAEAEKRGIAMAVMINPAEKQVSAAIWEATILRFNLEPSHFVYDQPNRRILTFAREHDIPTLDLLPTFRALSDKNHYSNEHWKPSGHQLVAKELAEFLLQESLVHPRNSHCPPVRESAPEHPSAMEAAATRAAPTQPKAFSAPPGAPKDDGFRPLAPTRVANPWPTD